MCRVLGFLGSGGVWMVFGCAGVQVLVFFQGVWFYPMWNFGLFWALLPAHPFDLPKCPEPSTPEHPNT